MIKENKSMYRGFASLLAGLVLAVLCAASAAAQPVVYTVSTNVSYSYLDIGQSGTQILAGIDEGAATINAGFAFKFYGQTYTSLCVSVNGLIAFGGCNEDFANLDFTSQTPPAAQNLPLIAPHWDDLSFQLPGSGAVVYQVLGTAPNRQLVIQWQNVSGATSLALLNFQVVLKETANTILFQYKNVTPGVAAFDKGIGATVGIRGVDGQTNGNRAQYSYNAATLSDSMAILFTPPATASATELVPPGVTVSKSGLTFNRFNSTYTGTITVKNTGTVAINRPITVLLTGLPANVRVNNATGTFPGAGSIPAGPYFTAPGTGSLAVNASVAVTVTFSGATSANFSYTVKVYSGPF